MSDQPIFQYDQRQAQAQQRRRSSAMHCYDDHGEAAERRAAQPGFVMHQPPPMPPVQPDQFEQFLYKVIKVTYTQCSL